MIIPTSLPYLSLAVILALSTQTDFFFLSCKFLLLLKVRYDASGEGTEVDGPLVSDLCLSG